MAELEDIYGKLEAAKLLHIRANGKVVLAVLPLAAAQAIALELAEAVLIELQLGVIGHDSPEAFDALHQRLRALAAPEAGE